MNYRDWLDSAVSFIRRMEALPASVKVRTDKAPPASPAEVVAVEKHLRAKCPRALKQFFTEATAGTRLRYVWHASGVASEALESMRVHVPVLGGPCIGPLGALPEMKENCVSWAEDTWVAEYPEERALWSRSLPFIRIENGDYIAIARNGTIVYLSHDDESRPIADGFDAFLLAWQKVCYIGPEIWYLEPFLRKTGHGIAVKSAKSKALRALFAAQ